MKTGTSSSSSSRYRLRNQLRCRGDFWLGQVQIDREAFFSSVADIAGHPFLPIFEWDVDFKTFVPIFPTGKDASAIRLRRNTYHKTYIFVFDIVHL